ncbi:MAG: matrixin family metalloprotease [Longimicrobiales bacterium]
MAFFTLLRTPLSLLGTVVLIGMIFLFLRQRTELPPDQVFVPDPCRGVTTDPCRVLISVDSGLGATEAPVAEDPAGEILPAEEACIQAGYLCADVDQSGSDTILRWPNDTPLIRVWVSEPEGLSPQRARALRQAAANGIRVWHEFPFPLDVSTRSVFEDPDITVEWVRSLGGNRLGHTAMRWSKVGEEIQVEITRFHLATHFPSNPEVELTPDQARLVAAHEMGHALGLPHSDDPRDVMYPQNTALRRTRRDLETIEALYRLPNGAIIRK